MDVYLQRRQALKKRLKADYVLLGRLEDQQRLTIGNPVAQDNVENTIKELKNHIGTLQAELRSFDKGLDSRTGPQVALWKYDREVLRGAENDAGLPVNVEHRYMVDSDTVVNCNLKAQMLEFHRNLNANGAFAFTTECDWGLAKPYLIERMQRLLRKHSKHRKLIGPHILRLYMRNIANHSSNLDDLPDSAMIIEQALEKQLRQPLDDFFKHDQIDVFLVVWNQDCPPDMINHLARAFWSALLQRLAPCFEGYQYSRRLIMLWLDANRKPLDVDLFVPLPPLDQIPFDEVVPYFTDELKAVGVPLDRVEQIIEQLKYHDNRLPGIYEVMDEIVKNLKGGGS